MSRQLSRLLQRLSPPRSVLVQASSTARSARTPRRAQWAATTYRSRATVTNRHPFALRELVVRDGAPVSGDERCVSVVLRHPAGLAELEKGEELQVGAEDDGREDKDKKQTVRWGKVVLPEGREEGGCVGVDGRGRRGCHD